MSNSSSSSSGISTLGLLGVAFVVLKLCGVIHWKWIWVTAPFWAVLLLAVLIFGRIFTYIWIQELRQEAKRIKKRRIREAQEKLIEMNRQELENKINSN